MPDKTEVADLNPKPKTRALIFTEAAAFAEATADGGVEVTLLSAGWSKNNRFYSREMIARAVPKFEGAQAYIDHPGKDDEKNRPERSVRDLAGYYKGVHQRASDGDMRGTFIPLGANGEFLRPLIMAATSDKPDLLGLSINAAGITAQGEVDGRKGIIVEDISRCISTDIVTVPAAGGKFETLRASADEFTASLLETMGFDEWRDARPDFIKRLREEVKTQRQDEALREATARETVLQETVVQKQTRIAELEEAGRAKDAELSDMRATTARRDRETYADRLMRESKLPSAWHTEMRVRLLGEANTGQWPQMVSGEQVKFAAVRPPIAVHGAGAGGRVITENLNPWPADNETPKQYAARKERIQKQGR